ncbi:MAG: diadenylate cyclase CdaA [Bacteroidales bacterium]|nr:diadenylate cyclase CdaA [Bacteroidales bacterium]
MLYQIYFLIKGTAAIKIFIGIAVLYLIWLVVQALDMKLISTILGHVMGVGVIALLIVFQQEVRKFFMMFTNKYFSKLEFSFNKLLPFIKYDEIEVKVWSIVKACSNLSKQKTGALITIAVQSELLSIIESGIKINADTSSQLIENLFFKNSPLHDGSIVIKKDKIIAAGCILPVSEQNFNIKDFGLRHRAAMGITEQTDAVVIVVSEENGSISLFQDSKFKKDVSVTELRNSLEEIFLERKKDAKK